MTEPIRWGVAATGGIAAQFAAAMPSTTGGEIVAVASRSIANAQAFGDRFGIARRHASYESLASDPDVDVVYVASPHACHAADTLLFLEAGKHVLCEKPFSINHASGATMVATARQNDRFLMEAIWSRFLPAYVTLAELLHDEDVGEPLLVQADFGFSVPVIPEHRLFNRELGGGALLDLATAVDALPGSSDRRHPRLRATHRLSYR
jgi:predicted dehydrogenase